MMAPLLGLAHIISDSPETWTTRNWSIETEIPISIEHPGSFLFKRKHHVHEGIDLYCNPGQVVVAMVPGSVIDIVPFTGEIAGTPHWNNTYGVVIEDCRGVWIYGEIEPDPTLVVGKAVSEGDVIGKVITVLRNDKGRPMTMLHLERYTIGTKNSVGIIKHGDCIPSNLCNPVGELTLLLHKGR